MAKTYWDKNRLVEAVTLWHKSALSLGIACQKTGFAAGAEGVQLSKSACGMTRRGIKIKLSQTTNAASSYMMVYLLGMLVRYCLPENLSRVPRKYDFRAAVTSKAFDAPQKLWEVIQLV